MMELFTPQLYNTLEGWVPGLVSYILSLILFLLLVLKSPHNHSLKSNLQPLLCFTQMFILPFGLVLFWLMQEAGNYLFGNPFNSTLALDKKKYLFCCGLAHEAILSLGKFNNSRGIRSSTIKKSMLVRRSNPLLLNLLPSSCSSLHQTRTCL